VGTATSFDETPSGLPATTEPEDNRSTFTDSAAAFPTVGQGLRGAVLEIIGGPGAGQQRLILGNDPSDPTHTLILNGPWREDPVAGQSIYRIERYDGLSIPSVTVHVGLLYDSQVQVSDLSGNLINGVNPLVFDSMNWDDFQVVRVTAPADLLREGFHSSLIQFTVSQGTADETLDQTDNFNFIPEENAAFFVGMSKNPVAGSTVVTHNGEELTEGNANAPGTADYIVLSNKIVFLDGTGDLQAVFGTISVEYDYVNPGFSSAFTAPVLARIQDADAPTVLVRESGGSTDVIE
jgi:hypothetical protein